MPGTLALNALEDLAGGFQNIDAECYRRHGQDPTRPIVGLGPAGARWCFFGRDPGEQEVRLQRPFVGPAGQKIRAVMAGCGLGDGDIYWMNTMPFKPVGNEAWSMAARRQCRPALLDLLAMWQGTEVIAFGEAAFKWFGLGDAAVRRSIDQFWKRPDRYEAQLPVSLELGGVERRLVLCPVPHPSGANAAWVSRFPGLLGARLGHAAPDAEGRP